MPRFVILPDEVVLALGLSGYSTIRGSINEVSFERRSAMPWDEAKGDMRFFMQMPTDLCKRAGVDTGDEAEFEIEAMDDILPSELRQSLEKDRDANRVWERLSPSAQRQFADDIASAKRPETLAKRLEALLKLLR